MRSPAWPHDCINSQFNGITVMSLVEAFFPRKLRPLNQQSLKLQGQRAKLSSRSLEGIVSGTSPFPSPSFPECESWPWEKQHQILDADLQHAVHRRGHCPTPKRCCPLAGTVFERPFPLLYQASSFWIMGNMLKPMNSMTLGQLSHFTAVK